VSVPPADDELLARLAATLHDVQEPPDDVATLARLTFGLRDLDAQLAELVADTAVDAPAAVRSGTVTGPRLLTFATAAMEVELQVIETGDGWDLVGQVVPPGRAVVRLEPAARERAVEADADELGRFSVSLPAGARPWRLLCRREGEPAVMTSWVLL
jgi:hypothetical protein